MNEKQNDKQEDKLKKIYQVKKELEKELEKKGIKITEKEEKKEKVKVVYKPDYEIEKLNVSINNLNNWFDLMINDIDLSNQKLAYFFELRLANKSIQEYNNQFGLMHLLRSDYQKAEKMFLINYNNYDSQVNLGFLKIIRKDEDSFNYLSDLIEKYPKNGLSYLTMSLFFLRERNYAQCYKFIEAANKILNYSYINIALSLYDKDIQKGLSFMSKSYLEGKAKKTLNLLNYYIAILMEDTEKASSTAVMLRDGDTACEKCVRMLSTSQVVEVPLYCMLYERVLFDIGKPKTYSNDDSELYEVLFYKYYNDNDSRNFNSLCKKIQYTFDKIPIALIPSIEPKGKPVFNLFSIPKNAIKVSLKGPTYFENLSTLFTEMGRQFGKSFTFYLDLPFFEALRLIFGWRICQFLYS
ncbi:MAG: hypothetical protein WBH84_05220 [Defluviitoga tunisiensis]|jgi:hypothetical protein|uniref:Tetratricopeptide repeat protein n=1 Tax=Defluviitoga tunisiensis TaxID=1006576 RepID=A0A0C7P576_DEFTU|nr:hypothetical protein [Defluviitoga tunisiensis]MDD3600871.1 hypothetical protein [Defluviitoga tunisiensis]CEP78984.1 hypothetical protein DTL3_1696 [Defluviitoga tunisiensis]HHV01074.1 hypothetical protein [Defluviitoga tunisiensis]HOP34187.1 hypothetical protein [Defluviitoga tunisiensis]HPU60130.1 hypothetical protein [Defluviitoga tunisiensis]